MSTYVNSAYAMKSGQGRHRPRRRIERDTVIRIFTMLAAFAVATIALSGAMVLLQQAGLTLAEAGPAVALVFASGASFVLMALLAGSHGQQ
jgi:predicted branched-subunit amino acid permease